MITSRLQRDLPLYNTWWQSGGPPATDDSPYQESRRSDYGIHLDNVREGPFYALVGADGSGKTATLYQIVHDLIDDHDVEPEHIAYIPLENPLYALESDQFILDFYEWYTSYIRRQTSDGDLTYLFFDDIHQIDNWGAQVNTILNQSERIHIAVTLPTEVSEIENLDGSLSANRSVLLPPKFYDFMSTEEGHQVDKEDYIYHIRDGIAGGDEVTLPTLVDECLSLHDRISTEPEDLRSAINNYLFNSGLRDERGRGLATIKQRLQLALYKDVQKFYSFDDPGDLFTLCVLVAQEPTQEYQFSQLTNKLDTDRRTIRKYLDILQDFLILSPSYKWGYQRHRSVRLYLRDPRYRAALNLLSDVGSAPQPDDYREDLIHSVVYDHLRRLSFYLNDYTDIERPVRYWNEDNELVEFVLDVSGSPIPVALSTRRGEDAATQAIINCLDDIAATGGIVAGEDIRKPYAADDQVLRLPLWMLLYIC